VKLIVTKSEVAVAAAIKWFREAVVSAPKCKGREVCIMRRHLMQKLEQLNVKADGLLRDLFEEVLFAMDGEDYQSTFCG